MGYRVGKVPRKDGSIGFKILFEDRSKAANGKRYRGLPRSEWYRVNVSQDMTYEQARERIRLFNQDHERSRREKARLRGRDSINQKEAAKNVILNEQDVAEFEKTKLHVGGHLENKLDIHWRTAKDIIITLNQDPADWEDAAKQWYAAFAKRQFSIDYVRKLLNVINMWGKFVSRRHGKAFTPIPGPRGRDAERIKDANRKKKVKRGGKKSAPLNPELLKKFEDNESIFNWIYLSLWFGCRPHEVNNLKLEQGDETWRLDYEDGIPVVWVYQSKLMQIPYEERWKAVPCVLDEQRHGLEIIESKKFKAPSNKFIQKVLGNAYTQYAGRKGFTRLMKAKLVEFEDASQMLGHKTLDRTYRDYFEKKTLPGLKKKAA